MELLTGRLKLVTPQLDHEQFDKFIITIKVMDNAILSKSFLKNFTLDIGNVNQLSIARIRNHTGQTRPLDGSNAALF